MARMHSRKKGHAGSKKPLKKAAQPWLRYQSKEVELLVAKVAKEGKAPSQVGLVLRDTYGIPSVKQATGKKIMSIMKEKHIQLHIPEDLMSLIKKGVKIRKHQENNKQDMSAVRGFELTDAKIKRLIKHYKRENVLPQNWSYDPEKIKLLIS